MTKKKELPKATFRHFLLDGTEFTGKPIPITPASIAAFTKAYALVDEWKAKKAKAKA